MKIQLNQPLDLTNTLNSGQAFRWEEHDGWHYGVIKENLVALKQKDMELQVFSDDPHIPNSLDDVWDYLRLDDNILSIYSAINTDTTMDKAISSYYGLRILRQDPWECLVAFICSANSSVPRISSTMQSLAKQYGKPMQLGHHTSYTFPSPDTIAKAGEANLRELKLGFRAKYVLLASLLVTDGTIDMEKLRLLDYEDAKSNLMSIPGVGHKVADCVLLFSLDKLDACPIDRWVRRALESWYDIDESLQYNNIREWTLNKWGKYAGYAQQYLFHSGRLSGIQNKELAKSNGVKRQ